MKDLSLMTWKEIRELDKQRSIVFVVMAPIEEHGLCLPLATDIIEGMLWSKSSMELIERRADVECFFLPPFPIAAASVNEFYGSIHFPMKLTYEIAYEILESIHYMGFRHIVLIASHADPNHQIAVFKAVRRINRKYGICSIAPMGPVFMGHGTKQSCEVEELENQYGNDFHAGWVETSCLLDFDADLVKDEYKTLPDRSIADMDMISRKKQFDTMGVYGHIGYPRLATKGLGKQLNRNMAESLCEAVISFYNRDGYQKYDDYFLYKIIPLHMGFLSVFGKVKRRKVNE